VVLMGFVMGFCRFFHIKQGAVKRSLATKDQDRIYIGMYTKINKGHLEI